MSSAPKAVFLSYASQDAEAARRVCEALRACGIEVWFDQNELRGGDVWEAQIRKQIKDCALFVPIVSANTEARSEGFFRLEWKLGVDRSHLMADDQRFLLPVAIDGVSETVARVPDRFREVQWSRLSGGEVPSAFVEQVRMVLAHAATAVASPSPTVSQTALSRDNASIAVLPFVNMSRDEENEYFADGLSEELLNTLAKIRGLRVASRTSAFFFKGKTIDIPTVAQKLGVATILEGSVRKSGNRVRITAQLIEVSTDSHLWSQTYDRELDDIFAVQDDIAQSVVAELRAALMGARLGDAATAAKAEVKVAATGRTENTEAHTLYLQGRFFTERMTQADLVKAVDCYERAVALDPEFALAWVGLSRSYWIQAGYGWATIEEGSRRCREAGQRALDLAPDLADAHVALAVVHMNYDWNWQEAEARLKRALATAPGNADVQRAYGMLAGILGRQDEALAHLRKAVALDPLSAMGMRLLGLRCAMYGHLDEGEKALRAALDLNPKAGLLHAFLAIIPLFRGRPAEALEIARHEVLLEFRLLSIGLAEHSLGHAAESDAALAEAIADHAHVFAYQIAELLSWRGEKDRAFDWLERAYAQRDPGMANVKTDPFFKPLREDGRWRGLLAKMKLE